MSDQYESSATQRMPVEIITVDWTTFIPQSTVRHNRKKYEERQPFSQVHIQHLVP